MAKLLWCPKCKSILREGAKSGDICDKHEILLEVVPRSHAAKPPKRKPGKNPSAREGTAFVPNRSYASYGSGLGGRLLPFKRAM